MKNQFAFSSGFDYSDGNKTIRYYPLPVFFSADLMEYGALLGIDQSPKARYPDISYLVPRKDLSAFEKEVKQRKQKNMTDAIRKAHELKSNGQEEKAIAILQKFSLSKVFLFDPDEHKSVITFAYVRQGLI